MMGKAETQREEAWDALREIAGWDARCPDANDPDLGQGGKPCHDSDPNDTDMWCPHCVATVALSAAVLA